MLQLVSTSLTVRERLISASTSLLFVVSRATSSSNNDIVAKVVFDCEAKK